MKRLISIPALWLTLLAATGCGLDNYEEPGSRLTGTVVYEDRQLGLSHGKVTFNLYQEGFDMNGPIAVSAAQDGTFSALLFDGKYRLETVADNGPWNNSTQPVDFEIRGNTVIEVPVTPYYLLSDVTIALNGSHLRSICSVQAVDTDKSIQRLFLCVGTTPFVSDQSYSYVARKNLMPANVGGNSISMDIAGQLERYDTLYARLGLQINGVQECIYSEVIKIK